MTGGDFLARMAAASHRRLDAAMARESEAELRRRVATMPPAPAPRFTRDAFHLIAEVKRRSPSAGALAAAGGPGPVEQARLYALGGAIAVSVLTEPDEFDGDLAHVAAISAAVPGLAVMRKDFLVGPYQVLEARAAGAAGVLLIAAMLEPEQIAAMLEAALGLGMFVLVEIFDQPDLDRSAPGLLAAAATAAGRGRVLLGVNCRDLRSLRVDPARFATLAPALPTAVPWVAESGIAGPEQAAAVARLGYGMVLIGTVLMRSADPAGSARAILAAGRAALATHRA